jgi:signal transduction histidine kinase
MIPDRAPAALPRADIGGRIAACARNVRDAWRGLTWTQFRWTLAAGAAGGLFFLVSHGKFEVRRLLEHRVSPASATLEIAVALGASIAVAFLILLAVSVAEYGDRGHARAWVRYVVATLAAIAASTALVHYLSPHIPVGGLIAWYQLDSQSSIDSFVFTNWLLLGGLAVFVYVRLRRARRIQAAFEQAELERVTVSRQVLRSQLAAAQAQVEPKFLFNTLGHVEALYERDAASADRMLDDLIAYLRAALPQLRGEDSTLARESELAEAYLRIVHVRMGSRLEFAFDIPMALTASRFPRMLLLPLIENALQHGLEPLPLGGRIEVRAASHTNRLHLTVSDNGLGDVTEFREGDGLTALRERLAALFGHDATLSLSATQPSGVTATLEVPLHEHTSDHR